MNTYKVSGDDPDNKGRRWWWRRPAVITAVAVLAAVLLITGGVLLGRGTATTAAPARSATPAAPVPSSAAASTTATASPSPTPSAAASAACPAGLASDVLPASAPADVVWRATSVAPVPYSRTWGPYRTTATGLPRCFSHSPTGAVIAVRQIDAWLFSTQWKTVLATQVARTPGYAELKSALESQPPDGSAEDDTVVGFDIQTYTPESATVALVVRGAGGTGPAACSQSLQWIDGDWQATPRPDGTLTEKPCPVVTAGTYIPWGPSE